MNGLTPEQRIWVLDDGLPSLISLTRLAQAEKDDELYHYKAFCVDYESLRPYTSGIQTVLAVGNGPVVKLTSDDKRTVTCSATGFMLDMTETEPIHKILTHPGEVKYFVGSDARGLPGTTTKRVRKIVSYQLISSAPIMSLPVPNLLTEHFFVVMA